MADLNTDVRYIKGIGEAKSKILGKLGIATLGDLINWFPGAAGDRREIKGHQPAHPRRTGLRLRHDCLGIQSGCPHIKGMDLA
ncbi:MAG: hypothetical protein ACLU38_09610 [Dysosmobacter sp.]